MGVVEPLPSGELMEDQNLQRSLVGVVVPGLVSVVLDTAPQYVDCEPREQVDLNFVPELLLRLEGSAVRHRQREVADPGGRAERLPDAEQDSKLKILCVA